MCSMARNLNPTLVTRELPSSYESPSFFPRSHGFMGSLLPLGPPPGPPLQGPRPRGPSFPPEDRVAVSEQASGSRLASASAGLRLASLRLSAGWLDF